MFGTSVILDNNEIPTINRSANPVLCIEYNGYEKIIYRYGGEVTVLDPSDNILRYCKNVLEISNLDSEEEKTLKQKYLKVVKDSENSKKEIEKRKEEDFISELCADIGDIGWCTF